jgi:hypothetical protein
METPTKKLINMKLKELHERLDGLEAKSRGHRVLRRTKRARRLIK